MSHKHLSYINLNLSYDSRLTFTANSSRMIISTHHKSPCPCGSENNYTQCCGRYIEAGELPEYPEQLMRSRYTAYALNNTEYLEKTWHKHTRPAQLQLNTEINWLSLEIIDTQNDQNDDNESWVKFTVKFKHGARLQSLHEHSRFLRENDQWLYVDGEIFQQPLRKKVSRNSPCPCGSGKKFKHCCIN